MAKGGTTTVFVRSYYDALGVGDPLAPFFADEATTVKLRTAGTC